jgi:peptide/nickel transport system substrate-binding protein
MRKTAFFRPWLLLCVLSCLVSIVFLPAFAAFSATDPTKIVIALQGEPPNYNALYEDFGNQMEYVTRNVLETMVTRDPVTVQPKAELATSWEQIEPKKWRFHLRKNVKFHDGSEFDADDVVASAKYLLTGDLRVFIATVVDAVAVDSHTVDLITKEIDPLLPLRLFYFHIVPAEQARNKPESIGQRPIGTGPYVFNDWKRGVYTSLKRFDGYWGEKPSIIQAEFLPRPEAGVQVAALRTGEVDMAADVAPALSGMLPVLKTAPSVEVIMLRFNTINNELLRDIRIRQAINYAIDRKKLLKEVYKGLARPTNGHGVPSITFGCDPNLKDYPYDLDKAKQLIKEAGAEGKTLKMAVGLGRRALERESSSAIAFMIEQAGLNIDLDYLEWGVFLGNIIHKKDKPDLRGPDTFWVGTGSETLLSDKHMHQWLETGGPISWQSYPKLDAMIAAAHSEVDLNKQEKKWQAAWKYIHENAHGAYICVPDIIFGLQPRVEWTVPAHGFLLLKDITFKK